MPKVRAVIKKNPEKAVKVRHKCQNVKKKRSTKQERKNKTVVLRPDRKREGTTNWEKKRFRNNSSGYVGSVRERGMETIILEQKRRYC